MHEAEEECTCRRCNPDLSPKERFMKHLHRIKSRCIDALKIQGELGTAFFAELETGIEVMQLKISNEEEYRANMQMIGSFVASHTEDILSTVLISEAFISKMHLEDDSPESVRKAMESRPTPHEDPDRTDAIIIVGRSKEADNFCCGFMIQFSKDAFGNITIGEEIEMPHEAVDGKLQWEQEIQDFGFSTYDEFTLEEDVPEGTVLN